MKKTLSLFVLIGGMLAAPSIASAQTALTGEELSGQIVDVLFSDGTRNAVYFEANGAASIMSPTGLRSNGTWNVQGDKLCLQASGASECWGYARRFEAGQAETLTSSCNETSQWTARAVNPRVQEAAPAIIRGERG